MKMTANRKRILTHLEKGPAKTSDIGLLLNVSQSVAYECLSKMADHGVIRNANPDGWARWELVK